ncbi:hypothetical protein QJS66_05340 [Kocuria rhizophila]|nr:hypothetical protein QJS66_05340 [Kocuria rhizophila]
MVKDPGVSWTTSARRSTRPSGLLRPGPGHAHHGRTRVRVNLDLASIASRRNGCIIRAERPT